MRVITEEKLEKIRHRMLREGMTAEEVASVEDLDLKDVKDESEKFYNKKPIKDIGDTSLPLYE